MSNLGDVLSKLVYSNVSQTGVWGRSPQPLGNLCTFSEKKAILIPLDHTSHVFTAIERTRFLTFESQSKKFNCLILLLLAIKVQNTFKILHYGEKF